MTTYTGLYHPYIEFRNPDWLKLSALYWDSMYRIVPYRVIPEDSDDVKTLVDAGYVSSRHPGMAAHAIARPIEHFISTHGAELKRKLGVNRRTAWNQLDHIHTEKMDKELIKTLARHELIQEREDWIGMHSRLACVYMTALAEAMAPMVGARPLAEESAHHVAVSGLTVERLAGALLGPVGRTPLQDQSELEAIMATLAITNVMPANLKTISAKEIVEFRTAHVEERSQFQAELNKLVEGMSYLKDVTDKSEFQKHLSNEYKKKLEPKLKRLKDAMNRVNWETVDTTMAATFTVPQGLATGLAVLGMPLVGAFASAVGIALTGWSILRKRAKARAETLKPSAEAFLYRIEKSFKPETVALMVSKDSVTYSQ